MGIKENVRRLRTQRELTQEQLAEMVGVNRSTITQWETGWSQPRMGAVQRLADALGVKISDIIEDTTYLANFESYLTKDEQQLVELYRKMDTRARHDLLTIAASLSSSESHTVDKEGAA